MKKFVLILIVVLISLLGHAQKRNNVWCFGDSSLINFSDTANILTGTSIIDSRGSCVSICDSNGLLLFYSGYDADLYSIGGPPFKSGEIYTNQQNTMANGDSIIMAAWYHEVIIIPDPGADNLFYVLSIGVTGNFGLYYAKIDISQNGGLGEVIQKNIQLQSFKQVDCLSAVKHGNGRDWWVVFRKFVQIGGNNEFYTYLIDPGGISSVTVQSVGSLNATNNAKISFSPDGNKMLFTNIGDLIEVYDFDRCTGVISNPRNINPQGTSLFYNTWGSEFSPSGDLLYISTSDTISYLYQYNLNDVNPQATRDTIWSTPYPKYTGGDLKRGPNGKIYLSCAYDNQIVFNYPYPDSMYNMYNMNLSVINSPDSLGAACDFQPWSFYLGGKRTYWGLPNNPDYDLGPLIGSPCDSLTSISEIPAFSEAELFVYYAPNWQTAFINANKLKGNQYHLEVIDLLGKSIFRESGKLNPPYFTNNLNCTGFANGMYVVNLVTEKEKLTKRFVVQ